eukprot:10163101-Alexandrium_andersonii.AAC.1
MDSVRMRWPQRLEQEWICISYAVSSAACLCTASMLGSGILCNDLSVSALTPTPEIDVLPVFAIH